MKIGYVRSSKKDQPPELQRRAPLVFGCERIFEEQISSRKVDRPEPRETMDYCREGDELVVWKLDCFGRSLRELVAPVNGLRERGDEFVSLRESIDTASFGEMGRRLTTRSAPRAWLNRFRAKRKGARRPLPGDGPQSFVASRTEDGTELVFHFRWTESATGDLTGSLSLAGAEGKEFQSGETGFTGTREGETVNLRFDEQGFLEGASASGTRSVSSALLRTCFGTPCKVLSCSAVTIGLISYLAFTCSWPVR